VDFSEEPLQARIMCDGIFKVLKGKKKPQKSEGTKEASEPDVHVTEILKF